MSGWPAGRGGGVEAGAEGGGGVSAGQPAQGRRAEDRAAMSEFCSPAGRRAHPVRCGSSGVRGPAGPGRGRRCGSPRPVRPVRGRGGPGPPPPPGARRRSGPGRARPSPAERAGGAGAQRRGQGRTGCSSTLRRRGQGRGALGVRTGEGPGGPARRTGGGEQAAERAVLAASSLTYVSMGFRPVERAPSRTQAVQAAAPRPIGTATGRGPGWSRCLGGACAGHDPTGAGTGCRVRQGGPSLRW